MEEEESQNLINDEGRRRAIRAAMEAGGHAEETILDALAALGLRSGGIVGLKHGGITNTKRIKNQPHMLAYITPNEAKKLEASGGQKTMTKEGIPAYPEWDSMYGAESKESFDKGIAPKGNWSPSGNGGNQTVTTTPTANDIKIIQETIKEVPTKVIGNEIRNLLQLGKVPQYGIGTLEDDTANLFVDLSKGQMKSLDNPTVKFNVNEMGDYGILSDAGFKAQEIEGKPATKQDIIDYYAGTYKVKDGGRIGLLRGGDPDDYSQQEDVGTFELQQEEGVPIGPMAGMGSVMKLFQTPYGFDRSGFEEMIINFQEDNKGMGLHDFAIQWLDMVKKDTPDAPVQTAAQGGRIGYGLGDLVSKSATAYPGSSPVNTGGRGGMGSLISNMLRNNPQLFSTLNRPQNTPVLNAPVLSESIDFIDENRNGIDDREEEITEEMAEGGVASVLPKGTEADYRGGGVIPVGSRERADDVPARLSKNEFVMTADAVKAAGGGSVNRGAKKMYNLMHNLEARV